MRKRLQKSIGWLVVILVSAYFAKTLANNWSKVQELNVGVTYQTVLATLLFATAVVFSGYLWKRVFYRISGQAVSTREGVRVHLGSWLLKYIPGQVGSLVYKVQWGAGFPGTNKLQAAVAFAYENIFLTLASTVVVIPVLLLTLGNRINSPLLALYFLTLGMIVLFFRKSMNSFIVQFIKRFTGKEISTRYILNLREISKFTALFSVSRLINAIGFVVLASSVLQVTPEMYVPLGAAYVLAGIIGIYALFVPSGLGVREAVIVAFASAYFTVEEATVIALLARLYATVADGLIAAIYAYLNRKKETVT